MTDITTVQPDDTLNEVVDIILTGTERDFVIMENGKVSGILYQSDLMQAFKNKKAEAKVRDVMDNEFYQVQIDDNLTDIYRKVRSGNKTFFPVMKGGKLAGAIDMNNINEFMIFRAPLDY